MPVTKMATSSQRYIPKDTRRSFFEKKRGKGRRKRKDELQREEIIGLIIKKKLLLSNYLEQNYAQVLQFQSKMLCKGRKKSGTKPE